MPLTLTIGSGPIALVQNGVVTQTQISGATAGPIPATLPAASTAGTYLLSVFGGGLFTGSIIQSMPAGWILLAARPGYQTDYEVWGYPNNPGGIATVSATGTGLTWWSHMSEWRNVQSGLKSLGQSGTASAAAGTTLMPITPGVITGSGDLVVTGWMQRIGFSGAVIFTSPAGYTRLADNRDTNNVGHLDIEYLIGSPNQQTSGPTLTSDTTCTADSVGAIVVLKAAPPAADYTAYLAY